MLGVSFLACRWLPCLAWALVGGIRHAIRKGFKKTIVLLLPLCVSAFGFLGFCFWFFGLLFLPFWAFVFAFLGFGTAIFLVLADGFRVWRGLWWVAYATP